MSKRNAEQSRAERAAAIRRTQERQERLRQWGIAAGVVGVVAVVVGVGFVIQTQRDTAGQADRAPAAATDSYSLAVGDADAPHRLVVYEDFLCPVCQMFESAVDEDLEEAAAAGEVYVEYRPFELLSQFGDYSQRATNAFAVVLDRAGPDAAKEFHDRLYAAQPSEQGPFPGDDWLIAEAVAAGAHEDEVTRPIEELAFEQWVVNATDQASKAGVHGTPTVLLDGKPVGGDTIDALTDNLLKGIA